MLKDHNTVTPLRLELAAPLSQVKHSTTDPLPHIVGLKTLLQQGISEQVFYGNIVYKFKRIVGPPKRIAYMRHSAPTMVSSLSCKITIF